MKFEHRVTTITFGDFKDLEERLDDLSRYGWELVTPISYREAQPDSPDMRMAHNVITAIFRREMAE